MLLFVVSITATFNILKITPQPPTQTTPKKSVFLSKSSQLLPAHPGFFLPQNHPNFHSSQWWHSGLDSPQLPPELNRLEGMNSRKDADLAEFFDYNLNY